MAMTTFQKQILNQLNDYIPALRKGQISPANGGDIKLGDLMALVTGGDMHSDGSVVMTGALNLGSHKIIGVSTATLATDALNAGLASGNIYVGSSGGVATSVAMSGQATIAANGAMTLSNAAVIAKVLTGYVAGTQGSVTALAATDTILAAIQKLDGNKADYVEATFTATFTQSVGAKTVVVRKQGKMVTLEIPTGSTADGGGGSIASGGTDITLAYRPAADLSFPVVVTSNAAKVFGKLVVSAAGALTFTASAAGANFTSSAGAGFDRVAVTYSLA